MGHSDLGGNVWEWTLDWFASTYTQHPCDNCADLTPTTTRAIRGGAYDIVERYHHRSSHRLGLTQTGRQANIGFRCAPLRQTRRTVTTMVEPTR